MTVVTFEDGTLDGFTPSEETHAVVITQGAIAGSYSLLEYASPNPGGVVNGDGTTTVAVSCSMAEVFQPGTYKVAAQARIVSDVLPIFPVTFSLSGNEATASKTAEPSESSALPEPINGFNFATAVFTLETPSFVTDGSVTTCTSLTKQTADPANPGVIVDNVDLVQVGVPVVPSIDLLTPAVGLPGTFVDATGSFPEPANTRFAILLDGAPAFVSEPCMSGTTFSLRFQFPLDAHRGVKYQVIATTAAVEEIMAGNFAGGTSQAFLTTRMVPTLEGMVADLAAIEGAPNLTNLQRNRARQARRQIDQALHQFRQGQFALAQGDIAAAVEHERWMELHLAESVEKLSAMELVGLNVGALPEAVGGVTQFALFRDIKDFKESVGLGGMEAQVDGLFSAAQEALCNGLLPSAMSALVEISGLLAPLEVLPDTVSKYQEAPCACSEPTLGQIRGRQGHDEPPRCRYTLGANGAVSLDVAMRGHFGCSSTGDPGSYQCIGWLRADLTAAVEVSISGIVQYTTTDPNTGQPAPADCQFTYSTGANGAFGLRTDRPLDGRCPNPTGADLVMTVNGNAGLTARITAWLEGKDPDFWNLILAAAGPPACALATVDSDFDVTQITSITLRGAISGTYSASSACAGGATADDLPTDEPLGCQEGQ